MRTSEVSLTKGPRAEPRRAEPQRPGASLGVITATRYSDDTGGSEIPGGRIKPSPMARRSAMNCSFVLDANQLF
jgi:hypothetical protein